MLKKTLIKMLILFIFFSLFLIPKIYSMENIKKIMIKEYTIDKINVQHFYFEKNIKNNIGEIKKENLLSSYLVNHNADGTMLKSIDGGLNWYRFTINNSRVLNFRLYPNPTIDILNFELQNAQEDIQNVSVFDLNGKIMNNNIVIDLANKSLDVHNLPKGNYLLTINSIDGKNRAIPFFKQ